MSGRSVSEFVFLNQRRAVIPETRRSDARRGGTVLFGVVLVFLVIAACTCAVAEDDLGQLKQRAATTTGGDEAKLCVDIARLELKEADTDYNAGEMDKAAAALANIVTYSEQAAQAALASGKNLKHTELALRGISGKLSDIRRNVDFEQRAQLQTAVDRIENLRTELLQGIFK
jgi:uncharacterized tellurite resistance protein B-like protein